MSKRNIYLPVGLASLKRWDRWDRALAFAVLATRMLAPDSSRRRVAIRTLFFSSLLERTKNASDGRVDEIRSYIDRYCERRRFETLNTTRLNSYRQRFHLKNARSREIRSMLTVGLTVKVMAGPGGVKDDHRTVETAQAHVIDSYQTNLPIYANAKWTRESWFKWKRVAHLCAALIDHLPAESDRLEITDGTLVKLEDEIESFATTALSYQSFLMGDEVLKGAMQ